MSFEVLETVKLYKDKEIIVVNAADAAAFEAKGYQVVEEKAADKAPVTPPVTPPADTAAVVPPATTQAGK